MASALARPPTATAPCQAAGSKTLVAQYALCLLAPLNNILKGKVENSWPTEGHPSKLRKNRKKGISPYWVEMPGIMVLPAIKAL